MATHGTDAEADLWRFALAVYGAEGIAEACLHLQDTYGADVPVLLCALWMADRGHALDQAGMVRLTDAVGPWHAEVVIPLRAVRQRMKGGPAPAPNPRTEAIRDAVKAAELNAERIELATLADLVATDFATSRAPSVADNLSVALAHYAGRDIGQDAAADKLVRAAGAVAGR